MLHILQQVPLIGGTLITTNTHYQLRVVLPPLSLTDMECTTTETRPAMATEEGAPHSLQSVGPRH